MDLRVDMELGESKEVTIAKDQILTYNIDGNCKLLGFFENGFSRHDQYIMCILETKDNQIDFSRMYFWNRDLSEKNDIAFYQYREVVNRDTRNDRIKKFR